MKPAAAQSRPHFDESAFDEFLESQNLGWQHDLHATQAELITEISGRVCYMSFGAKQHTLHTNDYIRNLAVRGHESVFEHVSWTFLITGVTRAFTHQLVRHRAGFSYSQLSQQYHDEKGAQFVPPREIRNEPTLLENWAKEMLNCRAAYHRLAFEIEARKKILYPKEMEDRERLRASRSAARSVLPACTATKIVVSANARALRHFLLVRGRTPGDYEMAEISVLLLQLMKNEAPSLFDDLQVDDEHPVPIVKKIEPDAP